MAYDGKLKASSKMIKSTSKTAMPAAKSMKAKKSEDKMMGEMKMSKSKKGK